MARKENTIFDTYIWGQKRTQLEIIRYYPNGTQTLKCFDSLKEADNDESVVIIDDQYWQVLQ